MGVRRAGGWEYGEPITIADNVWLGGGVIVCPGVTIGRDTVVGAGAVVTRDLPDRVVAAGVPARVRREIGEEDRVEIPSRSIGMRRWRFTEPRAERSARRAHRGGPAWPAVAPGDLSCSR